MTTSSSPTTPGGEPVPWNDLGQYPCGGHPMFSNWHRAKAVSVATSLSSDGHFWQNCPVGLAATEHDSELLAKLNAILDDAARDALNAGCKAIHDALGITVGDVAALYFSDRKASYPLRDVFGAYIVHERCMAESERARPWSEQRLPFPKVAALLHDQGESCDAAHVCWYDDLSEMLVRAAGQKNWSMGEVFVFAESANRYAIFKQIAPDSCEMLLITHHGIHDVLTAYRFAAADLLATVSGHMDGKGRRT